MRKRLSSLEKISDLQSKLHDLTLWRLAALEQKRSALEEDEREMLEAVDRAIADGAPAAVAAKRLRSIGKQIAAAKTEQEAQSRRVVDQGVRAKLAERLVDAADAQYRAQKERKDLGDLVERSLRGKPSSSA